MKVDMLNIFFFPDSTADGIFDKLSQCLHALDKESVDLQNWVGFCGNTTNSMMGCCHSLSTLITTKCPWVVTVKRSCHLSNLCAKYVCKNCLKDLRIFVELYLQIFGTLPNEYMLTSNFKRSPKFLKSLPILLLHDGFFFQQTLRGLLEQRDALILYWTDLAVKDQSHGNDQVLSTLRNPYKRVLVELVDTILKFQRIH